MWFKKSYGEADGERYDDDEKDKMGGNRMGRGGKGALESSATRSQYLCRTAHVCLSCNIQNKNAFFINFFLPIANYLTF